MPELERIIAVGFLTERDLVVLGQGFKRAYPIASHHEFDELLLRIDQSEARHDAQDGS